MYIIHYMTKLVKSKRPVMVPKKKNATNNANQMIAIGLISNLFSDFLPTPNTALIAFVIKRDIG
jgi:hypothetical protein